MKKALILGSTGLVGQMVLQKALADEYFSEITSYVRNSTGFTHTKYKEMSVNFEQLNQAIAADAVFCCLGTTMKVAGSKEAFKKVDFDYPIKVGELQKTKSKKYILISALGANPKSNFFYNQVKGQTEEALKKLNYESLIILRPSLIDGPREKTNQPKRSGEEFSRVLFNVFNPILLGPLARYRSVLAENIADTMIQQCKMQTANLTIIESEEIKKTTSV